MLFHQHLVIVRGGGDLGTGVVARLHRSGFPVVVTELPHPLTVRRTVAVSSAVLDGEITVEGMYARRAETAEFALQLAHEGSIPVLVSETLPRIPRSVIVDARLAKYNLDTRIDDAPLVVALGPGFTVGVDCHAVVETARGPRLGRVLREGAALPNTGVPGEIGGKGADRVLRTPIGGMTRWRVQIGDAVRQGDEIGRVGGAVISAPFDGVVRGLIAGGTPVWIGMKIGDVDPRSDTRFDEISDKALAIGGGVLEAVMSWVSATS